MIAQLLTAKDGRLLIFAIKDDRIHTAAAPPTISEISWVIAA